ncbi:hypothetical protein GOP47_0001190 [Adiantum capillus-veneris]|uniref:F-box domain-containing protein n=1 Tax=Adiantum capillus-veneris TaxID=13818 RepID=A0A9D4VED4_ADICA|nr:hypothetical protein GOP47_0001190 [Adiantum capillus-veneris]
MEDHQELHLPLPLHVAMKIFAHLPISCVAQLRLVCKSWRSLLSSSSFLASLELEYKALCRSGRACREWWFVMAASTATTIIPFSHDLLAFSYPLQWRPFRLPMHTSPKLGDLLLRVASSQSLVPSVMNMLVASAGGLMCAVVKGAPPVAPHNSSPSLISELTYDMVVFNCLTGELKTLPRPSRLANKLISSCLISMRAEEERDTYRIILCDLKYREMEIYDSQMRSWRAGIGVRASDRAQVAMSEIGFGGGMTNADVKIADLLESDVMRYHKEEIAAYDATKDRWRKAELALPRIAATELLRSTVVKCGGGVYLVACLMKQAVRMEGYGVWKLEEEGGRGGLRWAESGRTPASMVEGFERIKFESPAFYDCRFVGGGLESEWVCMTGVHYMIGSRTRAEYWQPVLFNVRQRQWHLLPPRHCLCIFPFYPHFTALP